VSPDDAQQMSGMMDQLGPAAMFVKMRFSRWDDLLNSPLEKGGGAALEAFGHFARGLASAAKDRLDEAGKERDALGAIVAKLPADAVFGYSRTSDVMKIAREILEARIARAHHDMA